MQKRIYDLSLLYLLRDVKFDPTQHSFPSGVDPSLLKQYMGFSQRVQTVNLEGLWVAPPHRLGPFFDRQCQLLGALSVFLKTKEQEGVGVLEAIEASPIWSQSVFVRGVVNNASAESMYVKSHAPGVVPIVFECNMKVQGSSSKTKVMPSLRLGFVPDPANAVEGQECSNLFGPITYHQLYSHFAHRIVEDRTSTPRTYCLLDHPTYTRRNNHRRAIATLLLTSKNMCGVRWRLLLASDTWASGISQDLKDAFNRTTIFPEDIWNLDNIEAERERVPVQLCAVFNSAGAMEVRFVDEVLLMCCRDNPLSAISLL